jgi:TolB protein
LPFEGGTPQLVTKKAGSFWHGWSPDDQKLMYIALRSGDFDIYVNGGEENRLTTSEGIDDEPDYSYDGKYIYCNSMHSGKMEIWRMNSDGSDQARLTNDKYLNWFPTHLQMKMNWFTCHIWMIKVLNITL